MKKLFLRAAFAVGITFSFCSISFAMERPSFEISILNNLSGQLGNYTLRVSHISDAIEIEGDAYYKKPYSLKLDALDPKSSLKIALKKGSGIMLSKPIEISRSDLMDELNKLEEPDPLTDALEITVSWDGWFGNIMHKATHYKKTSPGLEIAKHLVEAESGISNPMGVFDGITARNLQDSFSAADIITGIGKPNDLTGVRSGISVLRVKDVYRYILGLSEGYNEASVLAAHKTLYDKWVNVEVVDEDLASTINAIIDKARDGLLQDLEEPQ